MSKLERDLHNLGFANVTLVQTKRYVKNVEGAERLIELLDQAQLVASTLIAKKEGELEE